MTLDNKMSCITKDKTFRWKNKNVSEAVYLSRKKSSNRMKRKWEVVNEKSCEESSSTKKIRLGTRLVNLDILRAKILRVKMNKWCCDSEIKIRLYTRNDFPYFLSQDSNPFTIKNARIENAVHLNSALDSDVINVTVFLKCKRPISWLRHFHSKELFSNRQDDF